MAAPTGSSRRRAQKKNRLKNLRADVNLFFSYSTCPKQNAIWASFCTSPDIIPERALSFKSIKDNFVVFVFIGIDGAHPPPGDKGAATVALSP